MSDDRESHSVLKELTDELQVQAWLARREWQEPSVREPGTQNEASALARMRDEIRVQLHLGKLDARDEFQKIEKRWQHLMDNDIEPAANVVAEELEEAFHDVLREIRDGYQRLLGGDSKASS